MKKITEILRLKYEAKLSHEKIARACGLSKGAVGKYVNLAKVQGLSWPLPQGMSEAQLEAKIFRTQDRPPRLAEPDYAHIHHELKRKGVTLQLLWAEYVERHGDNALRYTQYCHRYRQWRQAQKRSMRQLHRAGEKLFIDYCGPTVAVVDRSSGELRQAQVFVAVLGASNYSFAEATWSQELPNWIASHQRAFRFFGGVPELLVPDNLLSAVTKACRYVPEPNQSYLEMARHYHTAILPARPYKPKDNAKAEAGVQLVERWILARLRHHTFFSLSELNQAIQALLEELNTRPFQKLPGSRRSQFESLDKPALKPLPQSAYEYAEWKQAKPGIDYHIEVNKHFYSVPHRWVGRVLDVRTTSAIVEIFHRGQRIASHPRAHKRGFSTVDEHMPKSHRAHRQWSPGRFLNWALTIWPAWQHFEEDTKGTIEVGKLADFVILSDNPLTVPEDEIADLKLLKTIKEGKSIYQRPAGEAALSSPAVFGLTLHDGYDHAMPDVKPVHGDGCFNHGLSVLMDALNGASASASTSTNP